MDQAVERRLLRSDFSKMPKYQRLEAMSRTGHPHCIANSSSPISWQLPLPYDVFFQIINSHLLDMLRTLCSLNKTCKSLAALCRPFFFRTITIVTAKAIKLSTFEKFATILSESPDIINYIQNLYILDRAMSNEAECLCYILARRYPNLKHLDVSFHATWFLLPTQVQHAFELTLSLPSLRSISLEHVQIPADLLSYLQSLQSLEILCEVYAPCHNDAYPNAHCTPKMLKYYNDSQSESGFKNIFLANSALVLSKLEYLEVYAPARQLRLFQAHFQTCYRTLTTLKVYAFHEPLDEIWNKSFALDLKSLAHLKSLVLYADIRGTWSGSTLLHGFRWMLDTLQTCYQPSLIDNIEIVIQAEDLADTKKCPWEEVERVLHTHSGWQLLKELHIRHNRSYGSRGNKWYEEYKEGYAGRVILPKMPILASMISVRFSVSHFIEIHCQEVDI
ncbi:hypothetical protein BJ912DRAFT_961026 [Pholiota molesta]|nr:hypothetical protein BJ912DRAFT_961026 [Pholiota molesta]